MLRIKLVLSFFILCPFITMAQSSDFVIENFRENTTDLSAISFNVKDLNGREAALIRFAVRDTLFDFDPNLGYLKLERKKGEVWLYVPQSTKRITISHPYLGIIRDYEIPIAVESKATYIADIRITNAAYLQALITSGGTTNVPVEKKEKDEEGTVVNPIDINQTIITPPIMTDSLPVMKKQGRDDVYGKDIAGSPDRKHKATEAHLLLGGGFHIVGMTGPYGTAAITVGAFNIEGGYVVGSSKIENISVFGRSDDRLYAAYNYKVNRAWVCIGADLNPRSVYIVTPQVGLAVNQFKGEELEGINYSEDNPFDSFYTNSAILALRFQIALHKNVRLQFTPEYHVGLKKDPAYEVVKETDRKFKSATEGFNLYAGIIFRL